MSGALSIVRKYFPEVNAVEDSDQATMIEVTKRDASSATVRNHKGCAMAVACKRKFGLDGVIVAVKTAYLIKGKKATRFQLPESVSREVVSFDRDGGFAPGQYKLLKVRESHKLGARQGSDADANKGPSKPKQFKHRTEGIRTVLGSKELS